MEKFITTSAEQTRKIGKILAKELEGGEIICLEGELGSGKTTFAQGILKGLKAEGLYTSPTFLIIKHYKSKIKNLRPRRTSLGLEKSKIKTTNQNLKLKKLQITNYKLQNIYHVDAYRVGTKDILKLGWEEIAENKNNVIIIEWADRIRKIIPDSAVWIKFKWVDENKRRIIIS